MELIYMIVGSAGFLAGFILLKISRNILDEAQDLIDEMIEED